jgi:flagellar basal-body rod protein FlgB
MGITDIPLFSMLRTRMEWHQERQRVLAENVANANTPSYQARDLKDLDFARLVAGQGSAVPLVRTSEAHIGAGGQTSFDFDRHAFRETQPSGNAVNLEDEMIKVANNNMDYQAATALYSRSLGLFKIALGKK